MWTSRSRRPAATDVPPLEPNVYDYESPERGFRARIVVDDDDLVVTYGSLWRRTDARSASAG
jgi:hypothetical protein